MTYSNFTGNDLILAEQRFQAAQTLYNEWYPNVIRWKSDKEGWFKRTKEPAWNDIVKNLETAKTDYQFILETMTQKQGIDIVDQAYNPDTVDENVQPFPWKTIGIAVGAIILIVIVFKAL